MASNRDAAASTDVLTRQQEQALKAFRVDGEAYDSSVWDEGVRPWPTMDNLVRLGYVERVQWWGPDEGWHYELTAKGHAHVGETTYERRLREARDAA